MLSEIELQSKVRHLERDLREVTQKLRFVDDRRLVQKLPKACSKSYRLYVDDEDVFLFDTKEDEVTVGFTGGTVILKDTVEVTTDVIVAGVSFLAHAIRHRGGGADELDGDRLDIDWNPTNYTPTTVAEAPGVDDLSAHLAGIDAELGSAVTDHGGLTGLADDDHSQYLRLAGRAGGQNAAGGTAANDDLTLRSTTHTTKGDVDVDNPSLNLGVPGSLENVTRTFRINAGNGVSQRIASFSLSTTGNLTLDSAGVAGALSLIDLGVRTRVINDDFEVLVGHVRIGGNSPATNLHVSESNTDEAPAVLIEQGSTGDAALRFLLTGGQSWSAGIDNDDADALKVFADAQLRTDYHLRILPSTSASLFSWNTNPAAGIQAAVHNRSGRVQTVGAGNTDILSYTTLQDAGGGFELMVVSVDRDAGAERVNKFHRSVTWRNNGGVLTLSNVTISDDGLLGFALRAISLTTSGNDIKIQAVGEAGNTINWSGWMKILETQ